MTIKNMLAELRTGANSRSHRRRGVRDVECEASRAQKKKKKTPGWGGLDEQVLNGGASCRVGGGASRHDIVRDGTRAKGGTAGMREFHILFFVAIIWRKANE